MAFKKIAKTLGAGVVTATLLVSSIAPAMADTTGGGGGGTGPGGNSSQRNWASAAYGTKGKAYEKFLAKSGYSEDVVSGLLKKTGTSISVCKASSVIWWVQATNGTWSWNWSGATNGSAWRGKGSIKNPTNTYGQRAPTLDEYNIFLKWDKNENGNRLNKKPGYTVICSGQSMQPEKKVKLKLEKKTTKKEESTEKTHPYTYTTTVRPQNIKGGTIGRGSLHAQTPATVKTNFGKLWDSLNTSSGKGKSKAELEKLVKDAVNKDKSIQHAKLNLDAKNKEGLADGGVLNVYEQAMNATVSTKTVTETTTTKQCYNVQKWNPNKGTYDAAVKECEKPKETVKKTHTSSKKKGTQKNTGFWQILSVHCNEDEFKALIKSDSSLKEINTGDASKGISAVAYTKKYNSQPSKLDFGDASNSNKAKAKTGSINFYDKECPFACTPEKGAKGASNNNLANSNVNKTGWSSENEGTWGAKSGDVNSNFFSFFRDNTDKVVKVDNWFPKSSGVVDYNGHTPLTTTIIKDPNGTPSVNGGDGGTTSISALQYKDKDNAAGKDLFQNSGEVKTQKNWSSDTFKSKDSEVLEGFYNRIKIKSSWASENDRPHAFNFKYEYKPTVSTVVPVSGIGFGVNSAQALGSNGTVKASIEGKCYVNYGKTSQRNMSSEIQKNTGTGTTNNLDKKIFSADDLKLKVKFVRSTTE